jgi:hypothetical protein
MVDIDAERKEKHQIAYYNKIKSSPNAYYSEDISPSIIDNYNTHSVFSRLCCRLLYI